MAQRLLAMALVLALLGCERYQYLERKSRSTSEPVRIDKWTGRTQVLRRVGGQDVWVEVSEPATATAYPEKPTPVPEDLPPELVARLAVTGGVTKRPGDPFAQQKLAMTLTNNTDWWLTEIALTVSVQTTTGVMPKVYRLRGVVTPGSTETLEQTLSEDSADEWKLIGAMGYRPQRR